MPFKHFLSTSLDFERTHQLILRCLLEDPQFLCTLSGLKLETYTVQLEPMGGLFDLGIHDGNWVYYCLIEIKMWSNLSKDQLKKQTHYLQEKNCAGLHVLLGTSDLQFYSDQDYDELGEQSNNCSRKIGYKEMDAVLSEFVSSSQENAPITVIASDYREKLAEQAQFLQDAWLNEKAHAHHRHYSAYYHIRNHLMDERFYIYSVNNAGGAADILNDDASWFPIKFETYEFLLYQELLDMQLMIRIEGLDAPPHIKNELKELVITQLQLLDPNGLDWSFQSKSSKYHKIAIYHPACQTVEDSKQIADILKSLNPVLKKIAQTVSDQA